MKANHSNIKRKRGIPRQPAARESPKLVRFSRKPHVTAPSALIRAAAATAKLEETQLSDSPAVYNLRRPRHSKRQRHSITQPIRRALTPRRSSQSAPIAGRGGSREHHHARVRPRLQSRGSPSTPAILSNTRVHDGTAVRRTRRANKNGPSSTAGCRHPCNLARACGAAGAPSARERRTGLVRSADARGVRTKSIVIFKSNLRR